MAPLADIFNDAPAAALSDASRLLFGEQNETRGTTLLALGNYLALRFQTKTKLWTAGGDIAAGDMLYYNNNWWLATAAVLAADNVTPPSDRAGWIHLGTSGSGGGGVTFLQGTVDPTAAAPVGATVGTPYINTASKSLWFKVADADPGAWIQISSGGQLVFPVFRYVRVTHGYADVPTLTGGVPGAGYRGGMFVTEPTADVGTVLTAYPRDADTASYDYHEFRVIYDASASFAADTAWDWVGKVDGAEHMPAQMTGLTRDEVLALLQHADAAAGESKQGTVTLATIRNTITAGLAVANSALRARVLKVFTDYLPAPSGGMGLRWKSDGTGLENYEISSDVVLRVVRFVRVAHNAAAPTLTGGTPGNSWRGGAFTTPPTAGNGGTLLGSWPASPNYDTYDYYQFSAEVDTSSAAAIVWTNEGKRDDETPPDTTSGLTESEVLTLLASDAAKAQDARRGTVTLTEIRELITSAEAELDDLAVFTAAPIPDGGIADGLDWQDIPQGGKLVVGGYAITFGLEHDNGTSLDGNLLSPTLEQIQAGGATGLQVSGAGLDIVGCFCIRQKPNVAGQLQWDWRGADKAATADADYKLTAMKFPFAILATESEVAVAKAAAAAAQATADGKAPKTTYEFQIAPAPETPSAPADNIFIPFTDPIAPQGAQDERVPVAFTFRKASGDVVVETSAYDLRLSSSTAPIVLADPEDATKEFIVWFISETSLGWNYRNSDDSAIANHGVLFVSVSFISRLTLDATNIPPTLDRGASDNGSLVNTKLLKRVIAMFPSVGQLGQQLADIMSLVKILKRDGVSQFLSHISLGADTVSVAQGFSRLVDLRDLTMSVADSAMNFIQEGSGAAWAQAAKIVSGLGAADGHLVGLKFKAVAAGNVLQLRKADGTMMNLITMKADGSVHFNSYHDAANEDDAHTIHVATDWSPTDFTGGAYAEAELPVIGEHWPGSAEAGSTDYNGATFAPFVVRLLERGVVAQAARVQLPALDPVAQANVHFAAEAVWVDTDVQLLSAGSEAVVQYRYIRRTDAPEVFARVYVQVRLLVTRGSVTGRVDDLHLNSTVNYTTHSRIEAGTTEAPALLTAAAGGELVFYSAAPLPAAPRAPTIAVYRAADGGESSYNDFYPERGSFDYDQVVLNTDIVSEFRHAAHTDYISHSELYAYARLAASMWVYAIGRLVSGSARVMVGIETGFSAGAENGDGKAFLVEGEGGGDGGEGTATQIVRSAKFNLTPDTVTTAVAADTLARLHPTLVADAAEAVDGISVATSGGYTEVVVDTTKFDGDEFLHFDVDIAVGIWGGGGASQRGHVEIVVDAYNEATAAWVESARARAYYRNGNNDASASIPRISTSSRFIPIAKAKRQRFSVEFVNNGTAQARLGWDNSGGLATFSDANGQQVTDGGVDVTVVKGIVAAGDARLDATPNAFGARFSERLDVQKYADSGPTANMRRFNVDLSRTLALYCYGFNAGTGRDAPQIIAAVRSTLDDVFSIDNIVFEAVDNNGFTVSTLSSAASKVRAWKV